MNQVVLIGRLARDPELSYTPSTQTAICRFTIAVDRQKRRDGGESGADFIRVVVWDRQAENCGRYLSKGRQVAVQGRITTGSYKNREGVTVYTTEVTADRVEFLGSGQGGQNQGGSFGGQSSFGGQNAGFGGQSSFGGSQNSGFGGGQTSFGGSQNSGFGGSQNTSFGGSQQQPSDDFGNAPGPFEGFDDIPDSFQAAEDDIPF